VTLYVPLEEGYRYRIALLCKAAAAITSGEHVVQGGPAFVRINKLGQTNMEIFNTTFHAMTINNHTVLGVVEKIKNEDQVGELKVYEMTANLEQKEMKPSVQIKEEKQKYILDDVKFARKKVLMETVKKKYIALLLEHHEATSNSLFDTGQSVDMAHDIQIKKIDHIYLKQFRIPEAQ
jgi:hypothetical protein